MEEIRIPGSLGPIWGELRLPAGPAPFPLVVLCHGFGGTHEGNRDVAAHFAAQGFATCNFDFCGGGESSRSAGTMLEMSVLTEAADLDAVLDHFRADPRFDRVFLWGASQGGFVAAHVAARRPNDVERLVLEFPAIVLQDDARGRANADGSFDEVIPVMGHVIGRKYHEDALSFDLYDLLGAYDKPVLILHGDADAIVPLRYSQRAAGVFPDARLVVLPGQGHGFTGAARAQAWAEETAFLRG